MARFVNLIVVVAIYFVTGCSALPITSSQRGRRDALRDIEGGRLINKIPNGRFSNDAYHIRKVLEDDYGIDTELVINDDEYRSTYNLIMAPEIYSKYGQDVFEVAASKGRLLYDQDQLELGRSQSKD